MSDQPLRSTDPGLQPERTALAWRRTALSMCGGALVTFRIFPDLLGGFGFLAAALALGVAATVLVASELRFRRDHAALLEARHHPTAPTNRIPLSGGGLPALTAAAVVALGVIAALALILR
ncbi:MAG TPA: DUF202 domain-containing protein [Galbitalea sp.]